MPAPLTLQHPTSLKSSFPHAGALSSLLHPMSSHSSGSPTSLHPPRVFALLVGDTMPPASNSLASSPGLTCRPDKLKDCAVHNLEHALKWRAYGHHPAPRPEGELVPCLEVGRAPGGTWGCWASPGRTCNAGWGRTEPLFRLLFSSRLAPMPLACGLL